MRLLIAIMIIYGTGLSWGWLLLTGLVWVVAEIFETIAASNRRAAFTCKCRPQDKAA